jgi:hypothetical protein
LPIYGGGHYARVDAIVKKQRTFDVLENPPPAGAGARDFLTLSVTGKGEDHRRLTLSLRKANLARLLSRQVAGTGLHQGERPARG